MASTMPGMPHINSPSTSAIMVNKGLIFTCAPSIRGSSTQPCNQLHYAIGNNNAKQNQPWCTVHRSYQQGNGGAGDVANKGNNFHKSAKNGKEERTFNS
jgi:hypothetical protein